MKVSKRALYVQNDGDISTIPIDDHIINLFEGYSVEVSHGFILEFRYALEESIAEDDWARPAEFMYGGTLRIPNDPVDDCIAAAFHVFNNLGMSTGLLPPNIAYILGHIYNILVAHFGNDDIQSFMINCDEWLCNGYAQES